MTRFLIELLTFIQQILEMPSISRHCLQSILSLMSFVIACVGPARIFMSAPLSGLRGLPRHGHLSISAEIRSGLEWWLNFLLCYNGISLISPPSYTPNIPVTDACANGAGGHFGLECFCIQFHQKFCQMKNTASVSKSCWQLLLPYGFGVVSLLTLGF